MNTKEEYAIFLASLIGEEINDEMELRDQFYGYFQSFMPFGKNVEKIFEPLPNGEALYQRIKPIFTTTEKQVLASIEQNKIPAYFVPQSENNTEQLEKIGKELLENFIAFSEFLEDEELTISLKQISEIVISDSDIQDFDNEIHLSLYDAFSDWTIENTDDDALISILDEAYYSISCDYFLSAYLQYPSFQNKPKVDFLKPYFELWKLGYRFVLNDKKLILFQN